ncbi:chromosome partition protein smc [Reticulomyxa filosa]|uniref:Chromosome partition protein smc n=1 Tax=Reticulomyxa filosa TaxID=46433 RepID=X6M3A3_RETFI|nr:chromosome partition protein smc [Reticulomyxa filosa]|eukprot:ETO08399.1 chromosome partition protein smc [Reticulomyxa filosa]
MSEEGPMALVKNDTKEALKKQLEKKLEQLYKQRKEIISRNRAINEPGGINERHKQLQNEITAKKGSITSLNGTYNSELNSLQSLSTKMEKMMKQGKWNNKEISEKKWEQKCGIKSGKKSKLSIPYTPQMEELSKKIENTMNDVILPTFEQKLFVIEKTHNSICIGFEEPINSLAFRELSLQKQMPEKWIDVVLTKADKKAKSHSFQSLRSNTSYLFCVPNQTPILCRTSLLFFF